MIGFVAKLLGLKFAPHIVLIAAVGLLGFTGASWLSEKRLKRENNDLVMRLATATTRANSCEGAMRVLSTESDRRKDETEKAIQAAQGAIQAANKTAAAISAPLAAGSVCEQFLELDRRLTGARR